MKKFLSAILIVTVSAVVSAANSPTSTVDEVDGVTVAARTAVDTSTTAISSRQTQIKASVDQVKSKLATSEANTARAIAGLSSEIDALSEMIKFLAQQCEEIRKQIDALRSQIEALEREIDDIQKSSKAFASIAQDRTRAATVVSFISSGNKAALLDFLKRETLATDIEIRDAKAIGGTNIVFRIGTITHCLSTNLQCSGRAYSLTK